MELLSALGGYVITHPFGIIMALVASYFIGFMWHGPLFGKMWMECNGMPMPKKEDIKFSMMLPGLIANFVKVVLQAAVLGYVFQGVPSITNVLIITTVLWLPFMALTIANIYAWSGKPFKLTVLDSAYELVSIWAMAAILFYTL